MSNLKYYSPVRLLFGLTIVGSALIKTIIAKLRFSTSKKPIHQLAKDGFIIELSPIDEKQKLEVALINKAFNNKHQLKSVVEGQFVEWSGDSSTHYLMPDEPEKQALANILENTGIIQKLSAHHGFDFYCKAATAFMTEATSSEGTTSTKFHRDGHPPFTYKLMVYLTSVKEGNGAFSIIPNSVQKLILPTFGSYSYVRHASDENYKKYSLYGDEGTQIVFNNNSLHAGGRTIKGHRIVVTYLLHPRYVSENMSSKENIEWSVGGREYSIL